MASLIYGLHCHPPGKRRITDQRTDVKILAFSVPRYRHSERRRERCRCVAGAEGVVFGFRPPQKPRKSAVLLDRVQLVPTPRQYLVCIRLMPDIEDETVVRRIKNIMHSDRKFDRTEARTGVTADAGACIDDKLANLVGHFLQVFDPQLA